MSKLDNPALSDKDCQNIIYDISLLNNQLDNMFKNQEFNPLKVMTKKEKDENDKKVICTDMIKFVIDLAIK